MDISSFAKKPELIKITLDDEEIREKYGDVFFWTYDAIDINTYFDFFRSQSDKDSETLNKMLKKLILNEQGVSTLKEGEILPIDLTLAALGAINEELGKSTTKRSTQEAGTPTST